MKISTEVEYCELLDYSAFNCSDPKHCIWIDFMTPNRIEERDDLSIDDCYIKVDIGNDTDLHPRLKTYRISLTEAKYFYDSDDKIIDSLKYYIVKCINDNYTEGIKYINDTSERYLIDYNYPMPDYNLLETQNDPILEQYYDFMTNKLVVDVPKMLKEYECSFTFFHVPDYNATIQYVGVSILFLLEAKEDQYYIKVNVYEDYNSVENDNIYRISLIDPEYIYDSEKLPENGREAIIKTILNTYKRGIGVINHDMNKNVFDPNRPIPDYWKL